MSFWRLLSKLWFGRETAADRARQPRRDLMVDHLSAAEALEDRSVCSTLFEAATDQNRAAEIIHAAPVARTEQRQRAHSRFIRLSVVAVDYLLEFEWFRLLSGVSTSRSRTRTQRRGTRRASQVSDVDPADEPSRTACVDEANWSITVDQTSTSGSPGGTEP